MLHFRAKSIGSVDMNVLAMSLEANIGLTELDLSSNGLTDRTALARGLAAALRVSYFRARNFNRFSYTPSGGEHSSMAECLLMV